MSRHVRMNQIMEWAQAGEPVTVERVQEWSRSQGLADSYKACYHSVVRAERSLKRPPLKLLFRNTQPIGSPGIWEVVNENTTGWRGWAMGRNKIGRGHNKVLLSQIPYEARDGYFSGDAKREANKVAVALLVEAAADIAEGARQLAPAQKRRLLTAFVIQGDFDKDHDE